MGTSVVVILGSYYFGKSCVVLLLSLLIVMSSARPAFQSWFESTRHYSIGITRKCRALCIPISVRYQFYHFKMPDMTKAVPEKSLSEWHTPASRSHEIQELIQGVGKLFAAFL